MKSKEVVEYSVSLSAEEVDELREAVEALDDPADIFVDLVAAFDE